MCSLQSLRSAETAHSLIRRAECEAPIVFHFTGLSPGSTYVLSVTGTEEPCVLLANSWLRTMPLQPQVGEGSVAPASVISHRPLIIIIDLSHTAQVFKLLVMPGDMLAPPSVLPTEPQGVESVRGLCL
jgi:hypothetical protein